MPASGFRVPVPVTSGRTGAGTGGKCENLKKNLIFNKTIISYALSCALPAFLLFFL
ncbi:unnamed protein product, partial [Staurois parvus]